MATSRDMSTFVFKQKCYPDIKMSLDRNKGRELLEYIPKYIDKNHDKLFNADFKYLFWKADGPDGEVIFNTIGKNPTEIKALIKESDKLIVTGFSITRQNTGL